MAEDKKIQSKQSDDAELVARLQSTLSEQNSKSANKSGGGFSLNKDMLTLAVLVILVLISGIQTAKLGNLQAASGGASVAPASSGSSAQSSGGSSLPASLQNLPSQVGGC